MKYSIIITTYNNANYIKKCIDSIINQTLKNYTLIIIDDGSVDNTKQIVKPYLKNKNIKYYYKKNTGVADSRNYGISKVKTEYFLFVDSDDYISPTLLETIDKYKNYDILSFKAIRVDKNYNAIETLEKGSFDLISGKDYLYDLMKNSHFFLVPWGYVYNTNFFKKNKFEYVKNYVSEDFGLTPIIILNSKKIISIDYYGYYYYQSDESITRTKNNEKIKFQLDSALYHYDSLIKYIDENTFDENFKKTFKHYFANVILWYGTTLNNTNLKEYIKKLKKRKVIDNLIISNPISFFKFLLFKINYKLYYKFYLILKVIFNNIQKKLFHTINNPTKKYNL